MPKHRRTNGHYANPDFRRRTDIPAPPVEEIERRLKELLTPAVFAPLRMPDQKRRLRERILTLPVMAALVLTLVWRRLPSLAEALRVLACEDMLWVEARVVSRQALSQRLERLPAAVFGRLFEEVIAHLRTVGGSQSSALPLGQAAWKQVQTHFGAVWIADGSTLEALQKRLKGLKEQVLVLGGKMLMLVEAFAHVPVAAFYTEQSDANDKVFAQRLLTRLPVGGLLIFDLGFFSFVWFDAFTQAGKFFLTRLRQKTACQTLQVLSEGPRFRDTIIQMGQYRSHPSQHPVRLVSVLWKGTWYHYLTNVLDPQVLSAQQVCQLYRGRWRIEEAFLLTKRLLGLSYLWVGGSNGIQIQMYATWIFYAVLTDLCQQVALVLGQPLERISTEMVFRGFYHFHRAYERGKAADMVSFVAENAKLLGIVKAVRKRHKDMQQENQDIWGSP